MDSVSNIMDKQLVYTFLSIATTQDTSSGKKVPVDGMKLISAMAHKYGVPVTWVIDAHTAQEASPILTQGHEEHGDDIILQIEVSRVFGESGIPESKAEEIVVLRQRLPEFIRSEQEKVKEILNWAEPKIILADLKSEALVEILEELECVGLLDYNWTPAPDSSKRRNTSESPSPDESLSPAEGCPWGFFYTSRENYDAPAQSAGGLVGAAIASLDLNSVFHTGNSKIFSAEINAIRSAGLYADKNFNYPIALLDEYLKNCSWNRFVSFIQQQSAYEMEYANYEEYDSGTIRDIAEILEDLFRTVSTNPEIQSLSLSQAIDRYKREFEYTESLCMIFDGIVPPHIEINYFVPPEPRQKPPYPFMFFYYDRSCQMIFKEGEMTPVEMRNYFRPPFESKHYIEKEMPSISHFRPSRDRDKLILEFEIESVKRMPYGLAIWDDHSMFNLVSTNALQVKWIGDYLLFVRVDLEEGLNRIEVSLSI